MTVDCQLTIKDLFRSSIAHLSHVQPNGGGSYRKQQQCAQICSLFYFVFLLSSAQLSPSNLITLADLGLARVDDGGLLAVLDLARGRASGLKSADNLLGLLVGDLAKDDVAAIEPLSLDGGDEELGAVAAERRRLVRVWLTNKESKVQQEGFGGRLTCWGQRWPWTASKARCASP